MTIDYMAARTAVGCGERPEARRASVEEMKAVRWMSRRTPSGETGSWSSARDLGAGER